LTNPYEIETPLELRFELNPMRAANRAIVYGSLFS
jgi:hypothetical protein